MFIFFILLLIKDNFSKVSKNLTFLKKSKLSIILLSKYNFFNFKKGKLEKQFISFILFILKSSSIKLKKEVLDNIGISLI